MKKSKGGRSRGNGRGSLTKSKSGVWSVWYFDADGRRRKVSSRSTNKADADRLRESLLSDVLRVKAGILDADALRRRDEKARPLEEHARDYFAAFSKKPRSKQAGQVKLCTLRRLLEQLRGQLGRDALLRDFTPERVLAAMRDRVDAGLSARTANLLRAQAVALAAWLTREGRASLPDFGARIPRFDESQDRRIVRRVLTSDEILRLLAVGEQHGRKLWYSLACYAGLRRGEIGRVTWGDVDLDARTILIRNRKAGKVDLLPLRPELADDLRRARPLLAPAAIATKRIFARPVHGRTQLRDFKRAKIQKRDAEGRVADLHAFRATLCTNLQRSGVEIELAQRVLRHEDLRTTQRHYSRLALRDVEQALGRLPAIVATTVSARDGTTDSGLAVDVPTTTEGVDLGGSSSGSSRYAKPRDSARRGEKPSTVRENLTHSQVPARRDDTGRFAKRREDLLSSVFTRALSSAG
jgi:integrase